MTSVENDPIMMQLAELVGEGKLIPVISNSFRIEEIFFEDEELSVMMAEAPKFYDEFRTFNHQLTKTWASSINYPLSDAHDLARVAQYLQVDQEADSDSFELKDPREKYLQFLNDRLLKLGEKSERYRNDEEYKITVSELKKPSKGQKRFSEVAAQLGYPQFMNGREDPLRLLAKLPVNIYITTSYSDFLERALIAEKKEPQTQLCFCRNKGKAIAKFLPQRDFTPEEKKPAVVHLFGLEDDPSSLVLSEDDYINFLMNAVEDLGREEYYPAYLKSALWDSSLLLLGYYLRDWDFRTLFRFLSRIRKNSDGAMRRSIAIQFEPHLGPARKQEEERSKNYLKKYFSTGKFMIKWSRAEDFIYELWETCNPETQSQS